MGKTKAGVDWKEIERRYRAGESMNAIAKDSNVSGQAIAKHRDREGWTIPRAVTLDAEKWLEVTTQFSALEGNHNFNPGIVANALEAYGQGANHRVAAALVGINENTWKKWRDVCPALQEAIYSARASHAMHNLGSIYRAAEDDWRAAERALQTNVLTRDDWASKHSPDTGGAVNVQINIGEQPVTVESTATDKTEDS